LTPGVVSAIAIVPTEPSPSAFEIATVRRSTARFETAVPENVTVKVPTPRGCGSDRDDDAASPDRDEALDRCVEVRDEGRVRRGPVGNGREAAVADRDLVAGLRRSANGDRLDLVGPSDGCARVDERMPETRPFDDRHSWYSFRGGRRPAGSLRPASVSSS
jgi:hypothetical protein